MGALEFLGFVFNNLPDEIQNKIPCINHCSGVLCFDDHWPTIQMGEQR
jgi:hypothetical protein